MIVFCHLFNDQSGSPRVLNGAIAALQSPDQTNLLFVGSQGRGVLENSAANLKRYWYRRSRFKIVTLVNLLVSQFRLFQALARSKDIPGDAIVYVNTLLPFGAAVWAKLNRRRLVYHLHEVSISPAPLRRFLTAIVSRTADMLIYVSDDHRRRLPIAGGPAWVLPNPVDPSIESRARGHQYAARRDGKFEVLMLASPRDFKGVPEFLRLARRLVDRSDIRFRLVLNADAAEISTYLGVRLVPANVHVHPRTHDPAPFYEKASLVMNLSRPDMWVETFGLTLAEAMCFGIPVIAPPVGGPAEIVCDGVEGFLIDSRDGDALAATVTRLADDPSLCSALSTAGLRRAEQFSQEMFARALRDRVNRLRHEGSSQ